MLKILRTFFFDADSKNVAERLFYDHIVIYKKKFFIAAIFMVLAALSTTSLAYLLQRVLDDVFTTNDPRLLILFCSAVLAAFVIKGLASYGEAVTMTYVGQRIISDIQNRLFKHLMKSDLAFFHVHASGELLSRFTNDVNMMRSSVSNIMVGLGKDSLTLVFLIAYMFYVDWFLAIVAFVVFPAALMPVAKIGKRMRKVTTTTQNELGHFTSHLTQIFQGIRVVKAYGMEGYEEKRIFEKIEDLFKLICKATRVRSLGHPIVETVGGIAIISVIAYGGWQVMQHDRTTGEFISFILSFVLAYEPFKRLSHLNANLQEGLAAGRRVFHLLDIKPSITSVPDCLKPEHVEGHIRFENVSFEYKANHRVLKNITLDIKQGQKIAFVGTSGAGKSTLINLLPRFYDVQQGGISIDGQDIKKWDLAFLRGSIALVSQDVILFNDTIGSNICYGTKANSNEEIIQAAKDAAAWEFIEKLPQGLDTVVGENGVFLSGGQRQRIAIARAMIKDAPILLLDEATSALDTESERLVQEALFKLMQGRTCLTIAHRLSTIVESDRIYVFQKGEIAESGTHQQLLDQKGIYAHLWHKQIGEDRI